MTKNILQWKRLIGETDNRADRLNLIIEATAEASAETTTLQTEMAELDRNAAEQARQNLPPVENGLVRRSLRTAVIILLAADVAVQYVMFHMAALGLSTAMLLVFAVAISVGIAAFVRSVSAPLLLHRYQGQTRRVLRILYTLSAANFVVAALGAGVFFLGRAAQPGEVPFILPLIGPAAVLLGIGGPISAGFMAAAIHVHGLPAAERAYRAQLNAKIQALGRFLEWLEAEKAKLGGSGPVAVAPTTGGSGGRSGAAAALLLLGSLLLLGGQPARAQVRPATVSATTAAAQTRLLQQQQTIARPATMSTTTTALQATCVAELDASASVASPAREPAVKQVQRSLPAMVASFGCSRLLVGSFADEGAFAPSVRLQVPAAVAADCPADASAAAAGMDSALAVWWSADATYQKQAAAQRCAQARRRQTALAQVQEGQFTQQIAATLAGQKFPRGACTDIAGPLTRDLGEGPRALLVVTDGSTTCTPASARHLPVPTGTVVVMVILPSAGPIASTGPAAVERAREWEKRVPVLVVLYPGELDASIWERLASGWRPQVR